MRKNKIKLCVGALTVGAVSLCSALAVGLHAGADGSNGGQQTAQPAPQEISVASLFSASNDVNVAVNTNTPSYVTSKPANGVYVDTVEGGKVNYLQQINLNDNTKSDLLMEIQVAPLTTSASEMDQLVVRFEDAVNPKIYMEISIHRYTWGEEGSTDTRVSSQITVKTNTISSFKGYEYKTTTLYENGETVGYKVTPKLGTDARHGTGVRVPFYGAGNKGGYVDNSCKLYYDDETKKVYAAHAGDWSGAITEQGYIDTTDGLNKIEILDLDSYDDMGSNPTNLFGGFTTGMVNVSITSSSVADRARYMILNIDGQTMDGEKLNDVTPPVLTVNVDEENIPYGIVGRAYPFFKASALDAMYGERTHIVTQVFRGNEVVASSDQGFVPETEGTYTVRYYAYDFVGNRTYKDFAVLVRPAAQEVTKKVNAISLLKGALPLEDENVVYDVERYQKVLLPTLEIEGASGRTECEVHVLYKGKNIPVDEYTFQPVYEGEYTVNYLFTDALGSVYAYSFRVNSVYTGRTEVKTPAVGDYMMSGSAYKIPKIESTAYDAYGGKAEVLSKIKVYNGTTNALISEYDGGEDVLFTPNMPDGGKLKVVYEVKNGEKTNTAEKEVVVLKSQKLTDRFVVAENTTMTVNEYTTEFSTVGGENAGFTFVNPVLYDSFYLRFTVPKDKNHFNGVDVYLTDVTDETKTVRLTFTNDGNDETMKNDLLVNGKKVGVCAGNFFETAPMDIVLEFRNGNEIYDSNGDFVGAITDTVYGESFTGFTSGFAFVRMAMSGVTGEAAVLMKYINNQMIGKYNNDEDFTKATVVCAGEITVRAEIGEKIYIPAFYAFDVFDSLSNVRVTIQNSSGVNVVEKNYPFGASEAFTYVASVNDTYLLSVVVEDSLGNYTNYNGGVVINVGDYTPPTLVVDGRIEQTATVGTKIVLPNVYGLDVTDGSVKVRAYVVNPNGTLVEIKGNDFEVTTKGTYIVYFCATDQSGNFALSEHYTIFVQ